MNKVILSGRICDELELKTTSASGVSVCSFRLAVQRRVKNAEGNYDTDFISCTAWRSNADFICKYFKKGDPIEIGGSLQTRNYEKDGQMVYITEVVLDEAGFVLSKKESNQAEQTTEETTPYDVASQTDSFMDGFVSAPADDDLPF